MFHKAILTFLAIGALSVNALTIPVAREPAPEPDFQDVEARDVLQNLEARIFGALVGAEITNRERDAKKRKKAADAANKNQPKRDISDNLFSREPEDWVQESKREASPEPFPFGKTAIFSHNNAEANKDSGDKPKKKHHHLFRREASPEPFPLGKTAVVSHNNAEANQDSGKPKKKKHHPFKREASPEPLPLATSGGTHRTTETVTDSGDKPKGKKKHHHLFRRDASFEQ